MSSKAAIKIILEFRSAFITFKNFCSLVHLVQYLLGENQSYQMYYFQLHFASVKEAESDR